MTVTVRRAESDADFEAWARVKRAVRPNESAWTPQQFRERATPDRLVLVAELGDGIVMPRVHPDFRRRGVGSALLRELAHHVAGLGFDIAGSWVEDDGSKAFAERFGFEEIDREVEQVLKLPAELPDAPLPEGVEVVTIAERPELLREAYPLAAAEGYAELALDGDVVVECDDWLKDEATLPDGSFVALHEDRIVGYSGLVKQD